MNLNKYYLKARYGITPEQFRKQLYAVQNRRCFLCGPLGDELVAGLHAVYDGESGKVVCKKCKMLLNLLRKSNPTIMKAALELIEQENKSK